MPGTGYDDEAMRIGARSGTRSWQFKLAIAACFFAATAAGAGVAWLFK